MGQLPTETDTMASSRIIRLFTVTAVAAGTVLATGSGALANPGVAFIGPGPGYHNDPAAVRCVQDALRLTPDGQYGQQTYDAVRGLQAQWGLSVDGVVGPQVGDRIMMSVPAAEEQLCFYLVPTTYYGTLPDRQTTRARG